MKTNIKRFSSETPEQKLFDQIVFVDKLSRMSSKDLAWELFNTTNKENLRHEAESAVLETICRLHPDFGDNKCIWSKEGWDYNNTI